MCSWIVYYVIFLENDDNLLDSWEQDEDTFPIVSISTGLWAPIFFDYQEWGLAALMA